VNGSSFGHADPTPTAAAGHDRGNAMKNLPHTSAFVAVALLGHAVTSPAAAEDYDQVLRLDHYVGVQSTVPAIAGQRTPIYVREVVKAANALRDKSIANRVVLFIHGAGTPAEVAFDVPYQDYSWMEYLAQAGFDTFAMDTTGYGRSTRPAAMNDPCNLSTAQQLALAPDGRAEACSPPYGQQMTTIASDWNDIGAGRPARRRIWGTKSRQSGQARAAGAGL
jgi:pimeloyl-ACP methyl ester carboxylesterase